MGYFLKLGAGVVLAYWGIGFAVLVVAALLLVFSVGIGKIWEKTGIWGLMGGLMLLACVLSLFGGRPHPAVANTGRDLAEDYPKPTVTEAAMYGGQTSPAPGAAIAPPSSTTDSPQPQTPAYSQADLDADGVRLPPAMWGGQTRPLRADVEPAADSDAAMARVSAAVDAADRADDAVEQRSTPRP